ncbi:hypothetical protein PPL_07601 [Heterostelium album PN500]|uniref:tRNA/rRNA methyltransferase SpoU type domain-containing protein n=1 Tax=Heterostelium pallidum (strain ATCC 26659 / Pp 5 / PN500) TaxID=670386 RepID=D3BGF0_HETP5|nr:hypothetical protein PPL_07601 [Heterostelium album PN500]EFA79550.1 hypothetical protein PPL_07601 [Heterostelium album PN500]|eukprot:XP_020431671.1 hypothetical protein PPL_07601 [Heterostelium album PN500]
MSGYIFMMFDKVVSCNVVSGDINGNLGCKYHICRSRTSSSHLIYLSIYQTSQVRLTLDQTTKTTTTFKKDNICYTIIKERCQNYCTRNFCSATTTTTTTTTTTIPNNLSTINWSSLSSSPSLETNLKSYNNSNNNSKKEKDVEIEDEGENDLITQCIDIKCSLNFKVPAKLRGKEGHCPQCSTKQLFKKHTSNYQRLLRKKRDKYLEEQEINDKLNFQIDLEKNIPWGISVLLDDCRSSENVGSFYRTCDGSGLSRLYLCGITATPANLKVAKTALGAEFDVPWSYSPSALHCVKELKRKGVVIIGIEQTPRSQPLLESIDKLASEIEIVDSQRQQQQQQTRYPPICLLFGNEVAGLSQEVIDQCDYIYDLEMRGKKRSLNVAVSFGIVAYVVTQRFKSLLRINK